MSVRTNEEWCAALSAEGSARDAALRDLREILCRGLRRALSGRAGADDALLEDLAQEALLKVLDGLPSFLGQSRFTTWAIAVAVRVAFTELRRARWKDVSLDGLDAAARHAAPAEARPDPGRDEARGTILETMQRVLQTGLTARQRQALVAELRGMPQVQIAAQMSLSRNALYKLTHDARRKLKQGLEASGISEQDVRETFGF